MAAAGAPASDAQVAGNPSGSHIGNLYPFAQQQADRAPVELSFLRAEFRDLRQWQKRARAKVLEHLLYDAPHEFNAEMQAEAWQWLHRWLSFKSMDRVEAR